MMFKCRRCKLLIPARILLGKMSSNNMRMFGHIALRVCPAVPWETSTPSTFAALGTISKATHT